LRLSLFLRNNQLPLRQIQRLLDRLRDARPWGSARDQPVDHHVDRVLHLLVELQVAVELHDLAVHAGAEKALLQQVGEQVAELPLLPLDNRGENREPRSLRELQHLLKNLLARLRRDRPATLVARRMTDPREQHPQVIVDLGDRADGAARVLSGGLLLDRDGRREAGDGVDVRLRHLPQKLPGVAGQRLDVPALSLGVQRVERQRAFARPADPRHHNQLVAGERQRNILQVVFAGATNDNGGVGHREGVLPGFRMVAVCSGKYRG